MGTLTGATILGLMVINGYSTFPQSSWIGASLSDGPGHSLVVGVSPLSLPGWGCRKHQCPVYHTKKTDGEVTIMLELWGMWSTPLLPTLPGPLWPGVVASDKVLSMGQIELN